MNASNKPESGHISGSIPASQRKDVEPSRSHAKHSPSALAYKEVCPGFESRGEDTVYSQEGTLLHRAVEKGDLTGLNEEQVQVARLCLDYIEGLGAGGETLREHKLSIGGGLTFGTVDYLRQEGDRADLVDFKFGRNPVPDAEENAQVQAYALGVFELWPDVQSVRVHILQPRRDEVSTASYTRGDVPRLQLRVSTIIACCEAEAPALRPTENCLWCSRQGVCPALHKHALTIAKGYGDELQIPDQFHPSQITSPVVMGHALAVARVMEKWCESVRHHALQMRLGGQEIPGHELRTASGKRRIKDPIAAWAAVKHQVPPEAFIACCDVSLPKLENAFAEAAPRGVKAKAKQELSEALADLGIIETAKESLYLAKTRK